MTTYKIDVRVREIPSGRWCASGNANGHRVIAVGQSPADALAGVVEMANDIAEVLAEQSQTDMPERIYATSSRSEAGVEHWPNDWGIWREGKPYMYGAEYIRADFGPLNIDAMQDKIDRLCEVVEWYGEQSRLARLIHSEGDAGRNALASDGGKKARSVLEG
jgi:hypothetical protein